MHPTLCAKRGDLSGISALVHLEGVAKNLGPRLVMPGPPHEKCDKEQGTNVLDMSPHAIKLTRKVDYRYEHFLWSNCECLSSVSLRSVCTGLPIRGKFVWGSLSTVVALVKAPVGCFS